MGGEGRHRDWQGEGHRHHQAEGQPQVLQAHGGGAASWRSYQSQKPPWMGAEGKTLTTQFLLILHNLLIYSLK